MPTAITIGGVDCYVLFESGLALAATNEGPTAKLILQCPWDNWFDVLKGLAGGASADGSGVVTYTAPYVLPSFGGLIAMGVPNIVGVGNPHVDTDGLPAWQYAQIEVQFGIPRYSFDAGPTGGDGWTGYEPGVDISGRPYTTTTVRVNSEVMVPPGAALYFTENTQAGQPVEEGQAGIPIPNIELSIRRHMMPFVPLSLAAAHVGKVNSAAVYLGAYQFQPGYLLFAGLNATRELSFTGAWSHEVEYILLGQAVHDWNSLMDRAGAWSKVNTQADGSGNGMFLTSNFWQALP